ncbi:MAG: amidase [Pseudomonadota bacterium]
MTRSTPLASIVRACQADPGAVPELHEAVLEDIATRDRELFSMARLRTADARRTAQALSRCAPEEARQLPLFGAPIAPKDLFFFAGEPCAAGTLALRDFRPAYNAVVVERLRRAGAVLPATTQLTEGAYGLHHPSLRAPKNPLHHDYWSGVSSSGSGVAVAAGLVPAALGTDTGGSIRFPCAANGCVGLKPSFGRIPTYGSVPLAWSLDHVGPMTRSVYDAALLLDVLAGPDSRDVRGRAFVPLNARRAVMAGDSRGLRVGVDWTYVAQGVDDRVLKGVQLAADALRDAGATLNAVRMPEGTDLMVEAWGAFCSYEAFIFHAQRYAAQPQDYGPALGSLLDMGRDVSLRDYRLLQRHRVGYREALAVLFQDVDLLLCPNMPGLAQPDIEQRQPPPEDQANALSFTAPFNATGLPTISLPLDLVRVDPLRNVLMPRTVQLVAPMGAEGRLLSAAAGLEARFDYAYDAADGPLSEVSRGVVETGRD